ncbi:MAG: NAD(P)/FAD-dependent oxidoreductase [Arenicella sp.]
MKEQIKVVIVGAGSAGLGCAALLKQMGIQNHDMVVLEAKSIGSSFKEWPKEMRMITPSFPSNGYHQTDLNAITPDSSPAFSLGKEHPTGYEYAKYLRDIVNHYQIEVREKTSVAQVDPVADDNFLIHTDAGKTILSQYLIWAGGEFSSPKLKGFEGSDLCLHNSQIITWHDCKAEHYAVIGSYESGVDAAFNLAQLGKRVTLIDANTDQADTYDPSRVLSPYTAERMASLASTNLVELVQDFRVTRVTKSKDGFKLLSTKGETLTSVGSPINCSGFETYLGPVQALFEIDEYGFPVVNRFDESTSFRNLYLSGPKLVHGTILLCFIYKFRGRFAAPCTAIGLELELDTSVLNHYAQAGMLLDDFACCEEQECFC